MKGKEKRKLFNFQVKIKNGRKLFYAIFGSHKDLKENVRQRK